MKSQKEYRPKNISVMQKTSCKRSRLIRFIFLNFGKTILNSCFGQKLERHSLKCTRRMKRVQTSIDAPISECRSCALVNTLCTSGGGVWRLIISITPPVKSCKASLIRPSPMASYEPQTLLKIWTQMVKEYLRLLDNWLSYASCKWYSVGTM